MSAGRIAARKLAARLVRIGSLRGFALDPDAIEDAGV